jgi:hypothetical protein
MLKADALGLEGDEELAPQLSCERFRKLKVKVI